MTVPAPRAALLPVLTLLAACAVGPARAPLPLAPAVDLARFMGDWYVIAAIPTPLERGIHAPVERYELAPDGTVATTFTYRVDGFDGEVRTLRPRGYVRPGTGNAVWGMQFVWPIRADYRIMHVDPEYRVTVIGRERRDYLWIMARTPTLPAAEYDALVALARAAGYDTGRLQRMPQPPAASEAGR